MYLSRQTIAQILILLSIALLHFFLFIKYLQHDLILDTTYSYSFFNSDAVFFNNLSESIVNGESRLSDWVLTGAPRIFPSIISSLLIVAFSKNNYIAHILLLMIQLLLFNILMFYLLSIFTNKRYSLLTILIIDIFLFFSFTTEPFRYILLSSHHFDNYLNFLLCTIFFFGIKNKYRFHIYIKGFLLFISSFSNPIFLVCFTGPVLLKNLLFERFNLQNSIIKNAILLFASVSGIILSKLLFAHNNCNVCFDNTYQEMDKIMFGNIYISLYHIKEFFISQSSFFQNICFATSFLLPAAYILKKRINTKNIKILNDPKIKLFSFFIISIILSIFCFLFIKINPQFRHLYVLHFSFLIVIPIILFKRINNFVNNYYSRISIFTFAFVILLVISKIDTKKQLNFEFYPKDIAFIDKTLSNYNVSHGFVKYEFGNRLIFLSNLSLTMIHFHKVKPLHLWLNKTWIKKKPQFIINLNPIDFGYTDFKTISNNNIFIHILR